MTTTSRVHAADLEVDAVVIGGGIAGASIAYELARDRDVLLLEKESTLAFHATGRSAAMLLQTYGGVDVRALTRASRNFFDSPPSDFETSLTKPRALLQIARPGEEERLEKLFTTIQHEVTDAKLVDAPQATDLWPYLRPQRVGVGLYEPSSWELDVHALHSGYVRGFRRRSGRVQRSSAVIGLSRSQGAWTVRCAHGPRIHARIVVNAAGAWADEVAKMASCRLQRLRPLRRTAFALPPYRDHHTRDLPLLYDAGERFYLKPENEGLLASPADATPVDPGDAKPDGMEIARALDEIRDATTLPVKSVKSPWAGLRTFTPDGNLVIGFDEVVPDFYWLAGLGGYGVQTAPGAAKFAAADIRDEAPDAFLLDGGFDPRRVRPRT